METLTEVKEKLENLYDCLADGDVTPAACAEGLEAANHSLVQLIGSCCPAPPALPDASGSLHCESQLQSCPLPHTSPCQYFDKILFPEQARIGKPPSQKQRVHASKVLSELMVLVLGLAPVSSSHEAEANALVGDPTDTKRIAVLLRMPICDGHASPKALQLLSTLSKIFLPSKNEGVANLFQVCSSLELGADDVQPTTDHMPIEMAHHISQTLHQRLSRYGAQSSGVQGRAVAARRAEEVFRDRWTRIAKTRDVPTAAYLDRGLDSSDVTEGGQEESSQQGYSRVHRIGDLEAQQNPLTGKTTVQHCHTESGSSKVAEVIGSPDERTVACAVLVTRCVLATLQHSMSSTASSSTTTSDTTSSSVGLAPVGQPQQPRGGSVLQAVHRCTDDDRSCCHEAGRYGKWNAFGTGVGYWLSIALRLLEVMSPRVKNCSFMLMSEIVSLTSRAELKLFALPIIECLQTNFPILEDVNLCYEWYVRNFVAVLAACHAKQGTVEEEVLSSTLFCQGLDHLCKHHTIYLGTNATRCIEFLRHFRLLLRPSNEFLLCPVLQELYEIVCVCLEAMVPPYVEESLTYLVELMEATPKRTARCTADIMFRCLRIHGAFMISGKESWPNDKQPYFGNDKGQQHALREGIKSNLCEVIKLLHKQAPHALAVAVEEVKHFASECAGGLVEGKNRQRGGRALCLFLQFVEMNSAVHDDEKVNNINASQE